MPDLRTLPPKTATTNNNHISRKPLSAANESAPTDDLSTIATQIEATQATSSPERLRARRSPPLSQAAIMQLQRTVGNQATLSMLRDLKETTGDTIQPKAQVKENRTELDSSPVVGIHERPTPGSAHEQRIQRYVQVNGGNYTTYVGSKEKMFSMQSIRPTYDREGSDTIGPNTNLSPEVRGVLNRIQLPQYKVTTPSSPPLILSDDGSLAVPAQTGMQSKVLYAVEDVITEANNRLISAGSMIRLGKAGNSISIMHNNELRLLHQVKPYAAANGPTVRSALADFGTSICIDMATKIVSGIAPAQDSTRRMIFQRPNGVKQRVGFGKTSGQNIDNVYKLAEGITDQNFDPGQNISGQIGNNSSTKTGENYGTALGQGTLDQKAQQLGINQYAQPEIGEAFSIHSIQTAFDETVHKDFSTGNTNMDTWGYHFAGVVAKSLDGHDYVTLENYNRAQEVLNDALKSIVQKAATQLGPELTNELLQVVNSSSATTAIMELLEKAFGFTTKIDEAAIELQQHINNSVTTGELWYFAMYGSNQGQTFHEIQSESGAYNNPMTVRTGHHNAPMVPISPVQGKLRTVTVTSNDVQNAGGKGEGGWGTLKTSSHWKLIYQGTKLLESKGYSQSRVRDLHKNILGWQKRNEERQDNNDAQKRVLLNRLRPELENILMQYKNKDYP